MRGTSSPRFRAHVSPATGMRARPFFGTTEAIDPSGAVIRVGRRTEVDLPPEVEGVGPLVIAFYETYGQLVTLKVKQGPKHLWTGPVRIQDVALATDAPDALLLGFGFGRHLRPAELRALGLA